MAESRNRAFGVRRRSFGGNNGIIENDRAGGGTESFNRAKSNAIRREQPEVPEFDFGKAQLNKAPGKYITDVRAKAKITPGAAFTPRDEEEGRLSKLRVPPSKASDFISTLDKIKKTSTAALMSAASTIKRPGSSLETTSAPTRMKASSSKDSKPSASFTRDSWQAPKRIVRMQDEEQPAPSKRPRVQLTPPPAQRKPPSSLSLSSPTSSSSNGNATRSSSRLSNRPTRQTFGMYDDDDHHTPSNASVRRRLSTPTTEITTTRRASTRSSKQPTEGTEAMPIHLSDSESEEEEEEEEEDKPRAETNDNVTGAVEDKHLDIAKVRRNAVFDLQGCRAWFGVRACRLDLCFDAKFMWISSISGVDSEWPLANNYKIAIKNIMQAKVYRLEPDFGCSAESEDPVERVMARVSFLALQFSVFGAMSKRVWREFYEPTAAAAKTHASKAHFIVTFGDDPDVVDDFGAVEDLLRAHVDVEVLVTKDEVRPFATTIAENDAHRLSSTQEEESSAKRARRRKRATNDAESTQLTYPLPPCNIDIVTITRQDVLRLKPRQYLNDNIIDYYFKRLLIEDYGDNQLVKDNVLFLSSHFYSRLRAGRGENTKQRLLAGYQNVSTWLARSNLFDRCIVFVPINKDTHWSMAVIINPRCAGVEIDDEDDTDAVPQTTIALLDPLGSYHSKHAILRHLRSFLELEWERVAKEESPDIENPPYRTSSVRNFSVKAPLQDNGYDCGVFVLKYAHVMMENFASLLKRTRRVPKSEFLLPADVVENELRDLLPMDAFGSSDVTKMRTEIEELLAQDTQAYEANLEDGLRSKQ